MHILKQNIFFVTGSLRTITNELSNMPKLMQIKLVPGKKLCRMCQAKVNNFDGDLNDNVIDPEILEINEEFSTEVDKKSLE